LKLAIAADENYLPAYSAYAALLLEQNKASEAVAQYQTIVAKKPSASVYTLLGMLEDARGNSAEAEKNYRRALEIEPDSPIAANNLAWLIAENQGNLDEALRSRRNRSIGIRRRRSFTTRSAGFISKKNCSRPQSNK
jgi:Flp pilus assembly protein TadD